MFTKIVAGILLLALVNSVVGCSYAATVKCEDARLPREQVAVSHAKLHLLIASLQRSDSSWLRFDSTGGQFMADQGVFVGRTMDGDSLRIALSEVESAKVYESYPPGDSVTEIDVKAFTRRHSRLTGLVIDTVEPAGLRIHFANRQGRFAADGERIMGPTRDGKNIDIPMSNVEACWTKERRFSYTRTFLLLAIPVGLIIGVGLGMGEVGLGSGGGSM